MSVKAAGVGHFQLPTAPGALTAVAQSASANTLGSAVSFGNAPSALYITGVYIGVATTQKPTYVQIQILVAASIVDSVLVAYGVTAAAAGTVVNGYRAIFPPIPVANGAAITVKSASDVASAVAWGVSLECIAQSNVVDDGITVGTVNLVNTLTTYTGDTPQTGDSFARLGAPAGASHSADVAAVKVDTAAIKVKTDFLPSATAGAAGGLFIAGSNAATTYASMTVTGATTHTGNVVLSDGLTISAPSTGNRAGLDIAGNGTGAAIKAVAGATGIGFSIAGGGTSGDGVKVTTTSGHGVNLAPVGTSVHGLLATGGNGGTSDGIKAAAGTGGVDFRANQTGNLTGTVATLTTYTGNTPQTGDAYARLGAPAGASVSADVAAVKVDTAAVKAKTDNLPAAPASTTNITAGTITTVTNLTNAPTAGDLTAAMITSVTTAATAATPTAAAVTGAVGSVTAAVTLPSIPANWITAAGITAAALNGKGDWNIGKTGYSLVAGYDQAKTAAQAGDAMALTSGERTAVVAVNWNALTSGMTTVGSIGKKLADWTIGTAQTGDSYARLGAPAGASVSADIAAAKVDTAAVKAKTDQLAFTVAGQADVNIKSVADTTVAGSGTEVSPWGPA